MTDCTRKPVQRVVAAIGTLLPLAAVLALQSPATSAQPGTLDPDFAGDGTVTHALQERHLGNAVMLEPDGSVIVIGESQDNSDGNTRVGTLTRYNPDGTLEESLTFSNGAFGCANVPRSYQTGLHLASEQYIAAGYVQGSCSGTPRWFDVRLIDLNGSDIQFDFAEFHNQLAIAYGLAVQPDGRIVAAGFADTDSFEPETRDIAIARYLSDGTLDPDFGTDGEVTFDVNGDADYLREVSIQDDNRIVAAGHSVTVSGGEDFLLLRLNADGTPDTNFGTDGIVTLDVAGFDDRLFTIGLQSDGGIVVGGRSTAPNGATVRFTVARFLADGTLDTSFADNGLVIFDFGEPFSTASDLQIDPTGRIYLTGSAGDLTAGSESRDVVVVLLDPSGSPVSQFASSGVARFGYGIGPIDTGSGLALDMVAERLAVAGLSGERDMDGNLLTEMSAARLIALTDSLFHDRFEQP